MTRRCQHYHKCADCGAKTECFGEIASNYDGFPELICLEFHLASGETNPDFICEACDWKRQDAEKADQVESTMRGRWE